MTTSDLLTLDEAAAYLRTSPENLRKWRTQGKGPRAGKHGKQLRYRRAELDRWILEREQEGRPQAGSPRSPR